MEEEPEPDPGDGQREVAEVEEVEQVDDGQMAQMANPDNKKGNKKGEDASDDSCRTAERKERLKSTVGKYCIGVGYVPLRLMKGASLDAGQARILSLTEVDKLQVNLRSNPARVPVYVVAQDMGSMQNL
jgi:hypothetical protein